MNIIMLVMLKKKSNSFNSVDYQNAGPIMNFPNVFIHARDRCFVTFECVTD